MTKQNNSASLLSNEDMGGYRGKKGYNFQDAFIASRIPEWLGNTSFRMLINEGAGDVQVRFEDVNDSHQFYQVKNHPVPPAEFSKIVNSFIEKDKNSQGEYDKFILACRSLGDDVNSLREGLERFRDAAPIYETQSKTIADTKQDLRKRLEKIGLASSSLDFLIEKVFFDTELGDMRSDQRLCHQFLGSIMQNTKTWQRCSPLQLTAAYRDVAHLVNFTIGKPLSRENIEQAIQRAVDTYHTRSLTGMTVRLFHWEDPSFDLSQEWDILLDWSNYFNRSSRRIPEPSIWNEKLIPQLEEAQRVIRSSTDSRLIYFRPSACLSAGIALGWAFSEVKGYTFEIEQGSEIWRTDIQADSARTIIAPEPVLLGGDSDALCVEFSQVADVAPKVDRFIKSSKVSFRAKLSLFPDRGIGSRITASEALAYSNTAKQKIRNAVDMYRCSSIHLFYAGPLGLAILFGRLLNSMHADVQCYEEQPEGYAPSGLLQAR